MSHSFGPGNLSVQPLSSTSIIDGDGVDNPVNLEGSTTTTELRSPFSDAFNYENMSPTETSSDTEDLEVRMAAAALSGLKQSASFLPYNCHYHLPSVSSLLPSTSSTAEYVPEPHQNFISRFVGIPIINHSISTITNAYEATKATNSVIKYSAETVESNIQYISNSVVDRLNPILAPVDRFACNQLDRIEKFIGTPNHDDHTASEKAVKQAESPLHVDMGDYFFHREHRAPEKPVSPKETKNRKEKNRKDKKEKSSWIGSMVLNSDTNRGLDYCLQWLSYSRNHIAGQVNLLKEYISSSTPIQYSDARPSSPSQPTPPMSPNQHSQIHQIKKEVVKTLRNVITVIGRYASICLPDHARNLVKGFILKLPERFALLNAQSTPPVTSNTLTSQSRVSSSSSINTLYSSGCNTPTMEAQNVMNLADEGDKMLEKVYAIFKQTKDIIGQYEDENDDTQTAGEEEDTVGMDLT